MAIQNTIQWQNKQRKDVINYTRYSAENVFCRLQVSILKYRAPTVICSNSKPQPLREVFPIEQQVPF